MLSPADGLLAFLALRDELVAYPHLSDVWQWVCACVIELRRDHDLHAFVQRVGAVAPAIPLTHLQCIVAHVDARIQEVQRARLQRIEDARALACLVDYMYDILTLPDEAAATAGAPSSAIRKPAPASAHSADR